MTMVEVQAAMRSTVGGLAALVALLSGVAACEGRREIASSWPDSGSTASLMTSTGFHPIDRVVTTYQILWGRGRVSSMVARRARRGQFHRPCGHAISFASSQETRSEIVNAIGRGLGRFGLASSGDQDRPPVQVRVSDERRRRPSELDGQTAGKAPEIELWKRDVVYAADVGDVGPRQ